MLLYSVINTLSTDAEFIFFNIYFLSKTWFLVFQVFQVLLIPKRYKINVWVSGG